MGELIKLQMDTLVDIPPDVVLGEAIGKLSEVIVLGYTEYGEHYFAASTGKSDRLYWLTEKFQAMLLRQARAAEELADEAD